MFGCLCKHLRHRLFLDLNLHFRRKLDLCLCFRNERLAIVDKRIEIERNQPLTVELTEDFHSPVRITNVSIASNQQCQCHSMDNLFQTKKKTKQSFLFSMLISISYGNKETAACQQLTYIAKEMQSLKI